MAKQKLFRRDSNKEVIDIFVSNLSSKVWLHEATWLAINHTFTCRYFECIYIPSLALSMFSIVQQCTCTVAAIYSAIQSTMSSQYSVVYLKQDIKAVPIDV
jgi:hypothetical protein